MNTGQFRSLSEAPQCGTEPVSIHGISVCNMDLGSLVLVVLAVP